MELLIHYKVGGEITYLFQNFSDGSIVDLGK